MLPSALLVLAFAAAPPTTVEAPARPKVDLNLASEAELVTLPGIGAKRAHQIVERRARRPFRRVRDLRRIKGIGRRRFAKLRDLVTVGAPPPGPQPTARPTPAPRPRRRPATRRCPRGATRPGRGPSAPPDGVSRGPLVAGRRWPPP